MAGFAAPLALALLAQGGGTWSSLWDAVDPGLVEHGAAMVTLGDVDGDGREDVAIAASRTAVGPFALAGVVVVRSGLDGSELYRVEGAAFQDRLGSSLAVVGDLDADQIDDFVVGAPQPTVANGSPGYVLFVSGASGATLRRVDGEALRDGFGQSVAAGGDFDGDGTLDALVGAPGARTSGAVYLVSGFDGSFLRVEEPVPGSGRQFGAAFATGADVDLDGTPDLAIGDPLASTGGRTDNGVVEIRSGATGGLLKTFVGFETGMFAGSSVAFADFDADGTAELLVAAADSDGGVGLVLVWHVEFELVIRAWVGEAAGDHLGATLAVADLDDDGRPDVLAGAPQGGAGLAYVFSGFHGGTLLRHAGSHALGGERAGAGLAGADVDGDGDQELLVGSPLRLNGGGVDVFDYAVHLHSTANRMSAAQGGVVDFTIDFGPTRPGAPYVTVVSGSGVGPTYSNGLAIPVTQDPFVLTSLRGIYPPGMTGGHGVLDAASTSSIRLDLRPGEATGAIGQTFYFSTITFDPPHFSVLASAARTLSFDP